MRSTKLKKTNNRAVLGFLLPFLAMAVASATVLWFRSYGLPFPIWVPLVSVVPALLVVGLILSIASIPLIEDLGDKDYAYSGVVLNGFLLLLFVCSTLYYLFFVSPTE